MNHPHHPAYQSPNKLPPQIAYVASPKPYPMFHQPVMTSFPMHAQPMNGPFNGASAPYMMPYFPQQMQPGQPPQTIMYAHQFRVDQGQNPRVLSPLDRGFPGQTMLPVSYSDSRNNASQQLNRTPERPARDANPQRRPSITGATLSQGLNEPTYLNRDNIQQSLHTTPPRNSTLNRKSSITSSPVPTRYDPEAQLALHRHASGAPMINSSMPEQTGAQNKSSKLQPSNHQNPTTVQNSILNSPPNNKRSNSSTVPAAHSNSAQKPIATGIPLIILDEDDDKGLQDQQIQPPQQLTKTTSLPQERQPEPGSSTTKDSIVDLRGGAVYKDTVTIEIEDSSEGIPPKSPTPHQQPQIQITAPVLQPALEKTLTCSQCHKQVKPSQTIRNSYTETLFSVYFTQIEGADKINEQLEGVLCQKCEASKNRNKNRKGASARQLSPRPSKHSLETETLPNPPSQKRTRGSQAVLLQSSNKIAVPPTTYPASSEPASDFKVRKLFTNVRDTPYLLLDAFLQNYSYKLSLSEDKVARDILLMRGGNTNNLNAYDSRTGYSSSGRNLGEGLYKKIKR